MSLRRVITLCTLLAALPASANTLLDGLLLGSSEAELQARFESLVRMRKPVPGPNGLRGLWALPDTPISGLPFQTTFYFKDKRVSRIEQRWTSMHGSCSAPSIFATIVADMASKYGEGLASNDATNSEAAQQSVVWQTADFDAMAYQSAASDECQILVVYKPHLVKDASEL